MLGKEQYLKLQELNELGLSKLKVSEKLNLSYKTVCNWVDKDIQRVVKVKLKKLESPLYYYFIL